MTTDRQSKSLKKLLRAVCSFCVQQTTNWLNFT